VTDNRTVTSVCTALVIDAFGRGQIKEHCKILHFPQSIKIHPCFWAERCCFLLLAVDVGQLTHGHLTEFIPLLKG